MYIAASSSCYGKATIPTSELSKIHLEHPYAFTKYIGELAVFHWSKYFGIKSSSIRIFNAYGLRSRTSGNYGAVIGVFMKQKLSNKKLTIVGDGKQKRDFVNVKDLVKAFYLVL